MMCGTTGTGPTWPPVPDCKKRQRDTTMTALLSLDLGTVTAPAVTAPAAAAPAALVVPAQPAVSPEEAVSRLHISAEDRAGIADRVTAYIDAVTSLDTASPEFRARLRDIGNMGDDQAEAAAAVSSELLRRPVMAMSGSGVSASSSVSKSLTDLRRTIDGLDPSRQGDLLGPRKLLGLLPFGAADRVRGYFAKYQSSEAHIAAIVTTLRRGADQLGRDSAAIVVEQEEIERVAAKIGQYIYLCRGLDEALSAKIAGIEASDPERARILKLDMLGVVRRKQQSLLVQLAVATQGYLAMDLIRRNNTLLIEGVNDAASTTVGALRTSVAILNALTDQRLALRSIDALSETAGNLIEANAQMLAENTLDIVKRTSAPAIEVAKLQAAFRSIYATIDSVDTYKLAALESMKATVETLAAETGKASAAIARIKAQNGPSSGDVLLLQG
jgi:uncharacterized protein YaaN involved in tellurite resistance